MRAASSLTPLTALDVKCLYLWLFSEDSTVAPFCGRGRSIFLLWIWTSHAETLGATARAADYICWLHLYYLNGRLHILLFHCLKVLYLTPPFFMGGFGNLLT